MNTLRDITDPERAKVRTQAKTYMAAGALLALSAVATTRAAYASGVTLAGLALLLTSLFAAAGAVIGVRIGLVVHRLADQFSHLSGVRDRVGPFIITVDNPVVQIDDHGTRFSLTTPARVRCERDPTWMQLQR